MKSFHMENDNLRLYFYNYERRSDDEEYREVMFILSQAGCLIGKPQMCPECDMVPCEIDGILFTVIHYIDGDGNFIYCDNAQGMKKLESLFQ